MRRPRHQSAPFCKGFVKDLKHLKRIWRIGLLSHEAPEAPRCSALEGGCEGLLMQKGCASRSPMCILCGLICVLVNMISKEIECTNTPCEKMSDFGAKKLDPKDADFSNAKVNHAKQTCKPKFEHCRTPVVHPCCENWDNWQNIAKQKRKVNW